MATLRVPATQGHSVLAAPYDARKVGPLLDRLRKTMRETSFMGMPIMAGADLAAFLSMTRSFKSLVHVSRRFSRHLLDLAMHGRAMQLVNGVALVARLAKSADDLGVQLIGFGARQTVAREPTIGFAERSSTPYKARSRFARRRLWCSPPAAFPMTCDRRKALFPRTPTGMEHLALPPSSCAGDGMRPGRIGGRLLGDGPRIAGCLGARVEGRFTPTEASGISRTSSTAASRASSACWQRQALRQRSQRLLRLYHGHGRRRPAGRGGGVMA